MILFALNEFVQNRQDKQLFPFIISLLCQNNELVSLKFSGNQGVIAVVFFPQYW